MISQDTANTTDSGSSVLSTGTLSAGTLNTTTFTVQDGGIRKDHIVGDFSGVVVLLVAAFAIHCILVYGMVKMFTLNKPLAESRAEVKETTDGIT